MTVSFTLEYWQDEDWYVGRLREVPGVFSQGETLQELEENLRETYQLMMQEQPVSPSVGSPAADCGPRRGYAPQPMEVLQTG